MNITPNLGLGKPLVGENYDISVPNANMDTIDGAVDALQDDVLIIKDDATNKRLGGKKTQWKVVASPGNTDATGKAVYTHGLGFTPSVILAQNNQPLSNFGLVWGVEAITATQFTVRFIHAGNGGVFANLAAPGLMIWAGEA